MITLGVDTESAQPVFLDQDARARGTYVIGTTGTGKTTLLQSIAYQDMDQGHGLCVLDPHGDMIDWLLDRIPPGREADVVYFNPADADYPFGLNLLYRQDTNNEEETSWVVDTIISTLHRLNQASWGPRLEHVLSYTLWTAMNMMPHPTLLEVLLLLTDEAYRKGWIKQLNDATLKSFWDEFPWHQRERLELIASTVNKLTPFLLDKRMRNIVGQRENTFNLRELMDKDAILLVDLSKGRLGEHKSALLGSVIVNLILIAALSRGQKTPEERRAHPFHVIVDEYQNFASESFSVLQSEARKYAVDLVVAHQFRDQLSLEVRGSALNVGNFICFRTVGIDAPELASQFDNIPPPPDPVWEPIREESVEHPGEWIKGDRDVLKPGLRRLYSDVAMEKANNLANQTPYEFTARLIIADQKNPRKLKLAEYSLVTVDPMSSDASKVYGESDPDRALQIRRLNQAKARPKIEVEEEILARTGGRADSGFHPKWKKVAASETLTGSEIEAYNRGIGSVMMLEE